MSKQANVLITGGTGLVGRHVARHLLQQGYRDVTLVSRGKLPQDIHTELPSVKHIQADILEVYPLLDVVNEETIIIHTAAYVSYDPRQKNNVHDINENGTANLINIAIEKKVAAFVHVSSIASLGRSSDAAKMISEKTEWKESKYNGTYAISKYRSDLEVWRGREEGLKIAIVHPGLIIGAGERGRSSLELFTKIEEGLSFYPTGSTGIVDVRDIASFVYRVIKDGVYGDNFLLVGHNVTYKDLFQDIAKELKISKMPSRPVTPLLARVAAFSNMVSSFITGSTRTITKQSLASASHHSIYDNSKSRMHGHEYTAYEQTIREACAAYLDGKGFMPLY